ncbi:hypothetical protein JXA32_06305 [Candidatus Sumerlaeota bacterium]|nr:hypothetical protein [Candidatus Sumerlaeota bacterium]
MSNLESIEESLKSFSETEKPSERLNLLRNFIELWYRPLGEEDGYCEEELTTLQIPYALRWFYRNLGRSKHFHSRQDSFLSPDRLEYLENNGLLFRAENQWCQVWAAKPGSNDSNDPAVYTSIGPDYSKAIDDSWEKVSETTTAFLLQSIVFEATVDPECGYFLQKADTKEDIEALLSQLDPLPLGCWDKNQAQGKMEFFYTQGNLFWLMRTGRNMCFQVAGMNWDCLTIFKDAKGMKWSRWDE